jgi:hypothetical protein
MSYAVTALYSLLNMRIAHFNNDFIKRSLWLFNKYHRT